MAEDITVADTTTVTPEVQHTERTEKSAEIQVEGETSSNINGGDVPVEAQVKPPLASSEEVPERPPSPMGTNLLDDQQAEARSSMTKAMPMSVDTPPSADTPLLQMHPSSSPTQPSDRPLNVTDALSYLDHVKVQFHDQPDVYNHFLDIMKEFKSQQIDTPGVIKRVSHLFQGHPVLIQGFNTFLPAGYRIECSVDARQITVTTPRGTTMQTTASGRGKSTFQWSTTEPAKPSEINLPPHPATPDPAPTLPRGAAAQQQAMEPAVAYVQKIKQRCDPEVYKQFLDILSRYHHAPETIDEEEVSRQIARLFKNAPDLRADFRIFMPDQNQSFLDDSSINDRAGTPDMKGKRKLDVVASSMGLPQKKKRRAGEREREREKEKERERDREQREREMVSMRQGSRKKAKTDSSRHAATSSTSDRRAGPGAAMIPATQLPSHIVTSARGPVPAANDPIHFFDRVKRAIDTRDTYNEFLKVINLFTQGYIDTATLVKESGNFLVGDGDLMKQFKEILGWDDRRERESWVMEQQLTERGMQAGWSKPTIAVVGAGGNAGRLKPGRVDLSVQYGSYRRLPANEINVACSGRDEMCRSVLNDEWVSHPSWATEETGFSVYKKNIYEDALHRSEEERHEYDFHIEAIARTIAILEPINNKIAMLSADEKNSFKLKPNLGGSAKAIHHRVVKKIYGREAGMDVIQAMQDTPAFAIPVVLVRLKQKEEEWKRGQREWHKVWREVDGRNYAKSLDHQCISFKAADKKALTTKAFVNQIEVAREEQMAKRASLIDPLFARTRPRHQLEFEIADIAVLQDSLKLVFSFLDRTQGQIGFPERKRIEGFLRTFIPLFFMLDTVSFNTAFTVVSVQDTTGAGVETDMSDDATSDVEMASVTSGNSSKSARAKKGGNGGGDLRKKLLAKSTNRRTRAQEAASPSISRLASPVPSPDEELKSDPSTTGNTRRGLKKNIFFTNTTFYVLLRLLEVLYSRLSLFKNLASKRSQEEKTVNPIIESLNLAPPEDMVNGHGKSTSANYFYDLMLESCERLFDNEIEQSAFEEQMRHMFGIKEAYKIFTVDKLIGVFIKQVQLIFSDPKSQDLLEVLKRDRILPSFTTQDQINSRRSAEKILGSDENIFRVDWLLDSKTMTVQLIGKDDSRFENSEVLTGRWQAYIESFVSDETSVGVPMSKARSSFLRRNLPPSPSDPESALSPPVVAAQDSLEIKICVHTYRLFFVSKTEDYLFTTQDPTDIQKSLQRLQARDDLRQKWLHDINQSRTTD
ncbi:hypothetical protein E1B28_005009 [Marasmius oreades]|uniref:Histone deacetylase interacting domain-containing protein n=1 Tax=Marasmius oreades TaxID=181124 RepID=A0A9P7UZV4_9AGAR|nr:uncharacterized protein E1B28_005009 [Marasmius oreades]KAG7097684.1 hypothetical protein E1B28_005009 [Marasmius oreades]